MSSDWLAVPLGEVLTQVRDVVTIADSTVYKQVTVRLWGKGAVIRQEALGKEIKTKRQFRLRAGQLVYSRIDARLGAVALTPPDLDSAIVSTDFPVFDLVIDRIEPQFLNYFAQTRLFLDQCDRESLGTSKRTRIKEAEFLKIAIPLPPLDEQRWIVARLDALRVRVELALALQGAAEEDMRGLLLSAFARITVDAPLRSMAEIAPLVRRVVEIEPDAMYPELGLRSYGKGTFHKPAIQGSELGGKRIYRIEAGDVVFSNVFSWEGAVAVVKPEDHGRYGSHRYISRSPVAGVITPQFLYFYFTTEAGLEQLRQASPGSAGRNRTLGLGALDAIKAPVPDYQRQLWFGELFARVEALRRQQASVQEELEAMLPAALDRAFRGEL